MNSKNRDIDYNYVLAHQKTSEALDMLTFLAQEYLNEIEKLEIENEILRGQLQTANQLLSKSIVATRKGDGGEWVYMGVSGRAGH